MSRINNDERTRHFGKPCTPANHRLYSTPWGMRIQVHRLIAARFSAACVVAHRESRWRPQRIDGYNCRTIRGSDSYSIHAWAMAWDFFATPPNVPPPGGVWTPDNPPDAKFVTAFTELGFTWGGTFKRRDTPHLEWASLPPGIEPSPQPPPIPVPGTPLEATGMKLTSLPLIEVRSGPNGASGLDERGMGTVIVPVPWARFSSAGGQALPHQQPDGPIVCTWGPFEGGTIVQVWGKPRQLTGIWVKVLDA